MAKQQTSETLYLNGVRRTTVGTTAAQRLRAQGLVPGVVYGKKTEAMAIAVKGRDLIKLLHTEAGEHALLTLRIEEDAAGTQDGPGKRTGLPAPARFASQSEAAGAQAGQPRPEASAVRDKPWERSVLVKTVQHHPVDGHVVHIDFHAIVLTERIRVKIPVELRGEPVGVKEQGGMLEHFLREVEIECLPTDIPKHIEFDVGQLTIGDAVHVRDLPPPPEATITSDQEGVVASVLAPKEEKVEEEAVAEEPEVISEKKEEAAEGEAKAEQAQAQAEGKKEAKSKGKKEEEKKG